jgi:flagellar hook-associated protein 1 FlgK
VSSLYQIASSGVRASQVALASTGQNIANVNTPGFSRLQTVTSSLAGLSGLNAGGGVTVTSIRRMTNDFHNQQLWRATTAEQYYGTTQQYLTALEGLMSGDGSSISVGLDQFFAAVSEASATPDSIALRQQIISEASNLAQRFNSLNSSIDDQVSALHEQRVAMATEINGLSENIALLNKKIVEAESVNGDSSALRDQRESLVGELAQYASLRVNETADGALNVALANGQPLVAGTTAGLLQVSASATGEQEVALSFAGTSFPLRQDTFGGAFGGLYSAEYDQLRPNQQSLKSMAQGLASMVNATLAGGYDLNGASGQALLRFDASSSTAMLVASNLTAEELALSSQPDESGNNEVLLSLVALKNQKITLNGSQVSLNDAFTSLLGRVASDSRQSQADLSAATSVTEQAQAQRDSVSAVNLDEEAVDLMAYQQAYQANMKVISTANQLFDALLAAF